MTAGAARCRAGPGTTEVAATRSGHARHSLRASVYAIAVLDAKAQTVDRVQVAYFSPSDAETHARAQGLTDYRVVPIEFPYL